MENNLFDKYLNNAKKLGEITTLSPNGNYILCFYKMENGDIKITRETVKTEPTLHDSLVVFMENNLQLAIDNEDYEAAVEFRNQLKLLNTEKK